MRTIYTRAIDIRSVAEAKFTPSTSGLTAVTGPNGAGKSTLTTAIPLLAGWGQTPPGTGNLAAIIRDGAKTGTVEWAFEIGGVEYVVSRTFRRTKAGASTARATLTIDGSDKTTTGLKPGDITAEITRITGMRPDTWLSTSLIAQSDVDALMSATPREVRDRIRDILGLRKIASAADAMAAEIRNLDLPEAPDSGTLNTLRERSEVTGSRAEQARQELSAVSSELADARDSLHAAESAAARLRHQIDEAEQSRREHETALLREAAARDAHDKAESAYAQALASTGSGWSGPASEALSLAEEQLHALRYRQARVAELAPVARSSTGDLDALRSALDKATRDKESAAQKFDQAQNDPSYEEARERLSRASSLVGVLESTRAALADDGHCPTCGTVVGHAGDLTARLDAQIATAHAEECSSRELVNEIDSARSVLSAKLSAAQKAVQEASSSLDAAERQAQHVLDARAELEQIGDTSGLDAAIQTMVLVQDTAREVVRSSRELSMATAAALSGVKILDAPSDRDVENARQAYESATAVVQEVTGRAHAAQARAAELEPAAQEAYDEWSLAQQKFDARAVAEKEVAEKSAAATLLKRFTTAYTSEKVGVITDAVNRLLPLTSGEFTDFQLDADFAPTVNYAGAVRSTSDLSGGERSILGLLFRIGVTAAMTGGALTGTIIADEPLAALDSQSRQRVTSMLSGLPVPVVLVSHTSEAAEVASVTANIQRARFGTTEVSMVTAP